MHSKIMFDYLGIFYFVNLGLEYTFLVLLGAAGATVRAVSRARSDPSPVCPLSWDDLPGLFHQGALLSALRVFTVRSWLRAGRGGGGGDCALWPLPRLTCRRGAVRHRTGRSLVVQCFCSVMCSV